MKLKVDAEGRAVLSDGKPVYVHDDGKEVPFDAAATVATISRLNGEAKGHRERAELAEGKLKGFEGIADPAAALKALGVVANLDAKKLVDAGEVDKVKAEAIKAVEDKYKPVLADNERLLNEIRSEKIGGSFARSKFITDKLVAPVPMVEATFGKHFELKDGKIVAKGPDGGPIFSRANPGNLADFDEALEALVNASPFKDSILKGSGGAGSGARQPGGGAGGPKTLTRAEFNRLAPIDQAARAKDHKIVD